MDRAERQQTTNGDDLRVGAAARPALVVLESIRRLVDELDPEQVPARHAVDLVRVFDRMERVASTGKALAASRVAESAEWRRSGSRSPAHWMAKETGVTTGDASRLLETARAVKQAPHVDAARRKGTISDRQARPLARAAEADPAAAKDLLERCGRMSVNDLDNEANRIVAAASTETDADRARRHRSIRSLSTGLDSEGMGWGRWRLPPAEHARVLAELAPGTEAAFQAARRAGTRERPDAYAADGLVALADRAAGLEPGPADQPDPADPGTGPAAPKGRAGPGWGGAKVILRIDAAALDRGELAPGEISEIVGVGPIPICEAWKIIDGGAFVAVVTTRGTTIDQVVHLGRRPTVLQRTALEWMTAGTCAIEGCDSTARLEIDHVEDWAATHQTRLRDLAAVCGHHHDLKTHQGYRFGPVLPSGRRRLLPPGEAEDVPDERPPPGGDPPPEDGDRPRPARDNGGDHDVGAGPAQGDLFDTG